VPDCKNCPECKSCFPEPERGLIVTRCTGTERTTSTPCHRKGCNGRAITNEVLDPECGLWFPEPKKPGEDEPRFGFCDDGCFIAFVEQWFVRRPAGQKHGHRGDGNDGLTRQGLVALDGGKKKGCHNR
jgi:hypothetical protein